MNTDKETPMKHQIVIRRQPQPLAYIVYVDGARIGVTPTRKDAKALADHYLTCAQPDN